MCPSSQLEGVGNTAILAFSFHWDIPRLKTRQEPYPALPLPPIFNAPNVAYFNQTIQHLMDLLNRAMRLTNPDESHRLRQTAELLLKSLLLEISVAERQTPMMNHHQVTIDRLVSAMQEDPRRFRSVKEMAVFCGYSLSHFRAVCHEVLDISPAELMIRNRIAHAKSFLRYTNLTVSAIAEMVGYENVYYFSRQFRECTGMTPSTYRQVSAEQPANLPFSIQPINSP